MKLLALIKLNIILLKIYDKKFKKFIYYKILKMKIY